MNETAPHQPTIRPLLTPQPENNAQPLNYQPVSQTPQRSNNLIHSLDESQTGSSKRGVLMTIVVALLIIVAGSATGYILASSTQQAATSSNDENRSISAPEGSTTVSKANEEGINDDDLFPDHAEGVLQLNDGSISNEGTHVLIREGGPDKTAFLTSSVIDLTKYEGKQVEVKGQTLASQTAGWFMDVGWIKVK